MIENILALQDLPSLFSLGVEEFSGSGAEPADGGSCTACSYTCSKTLSE